MSVPIHSPDLSVVLRRPPTPKTSCVIPVIHRYHHRRCHSLFSLQCYLPKPQVMTNWMLLHCLLFTTHTLHPSIRPSVHPPIRSTPPPPLPPSLPPPGSLSPQATVPASQPRPLIYILTIPRLTATALPPVPQSWAPCRRCASVYWCGRTITGFRITLDQQNASVLLTACRIRISGPHTHARTHTRTHTRTLIHTHTRKLTNTRLTM